VPLQCGLIAFPFFEAHPHKDPQRFRLGGLRELGASEILYVGKDVVG
jgi:hypothetical protein